MTFFIICAPPLRAGDGVTVIDDDVTRWRLEIAAEAAAAAAAERTYLLSASDVH